MERPYLIDTLNRSGIDPTSDLVDKVVELQRLVFLKINAGSFSRRCAALVELSCRILDIPITKSKLYSALGYKFKQNEYAHELALLKSTLKINFDNNSIWEKLNIIYGEDICTRAQSLFQDFHQKYSSSKMHILPIDVNTTSYKCASLYIVGQMEKVRIILFLFTSFVFV